MTDAEISHKLALAIGWKPNECRTNHTGYGDEKRTEVFFHPPSSPEGFRIWRSFKYTDPTVIWPIAKHYKCFPYHCPFDRPDRRWAAFLGRKVYEAATPEMAVALAVIGSA